MAINLVGQANWDKYREVMRDAHETFAKQEIKWLRSLGAIDIHGEDRATETFNEITLEVLMQYNAFRTWPVTRAMDGGEQDKENSAILMNRDYLIELGYITAAGNFDFNAANDRFIIEGIVHKAMGDTPTSQEHSDPLWVMIIVKREELYTGQFVINSDLP